MSSCSAHRDSFVRILHTLIIGWESRLDVISDDLPEAHDLRSLVEKVTSLLRDEFGEDV